MTQTDTYPENVAREIAALLRFGGNKRAFAFGYLGQAGHFLWSEPLRHDYRFDITYDKHRRRFKLSIDTYEPANDEEWDDDAWEAGRRIFLLTPLHNDMRKAFRDISGIARSLFIDRWLELSDGRYINEPELVERQS